MERIFESDLVDLIAKDTGITKKDIKRVMSSFRKNVSENAIAGRAVTLKNLFTVKRYLRKGRTGRMPDGKGGVKEQEFPDRYLLRFIPGKALKDAVRATPVEE